MVSFNDKGLLTIHTNIDAESYAYTLKGLTIILQELTTAEQAHNGFSPSFIDGIFYTFEILKALLPNESQTPQLDFLHLKDTTRATG